MKTKKAKDENSFGGSMTLIKDAVIEFITGFFENLAKQLQEEAKKKLENFVLDTKKIAVFLFLMITGLIFVLIGMAKTVDQITGLHGSGFVLFGLILLAIGFLFNLLSKKPKE